MMRDPILRKPSLLISEVCTKAASVGGSTSAAE